METRTYCCLCDDMVTYTTTSEVQTLHVDGNPVYYNAIICKCDRCGEKVHVEEYFMVNLQRMQDIYKQRRDNT